MSNPRLRATVERLLVEGEAVLATKHNTKYSRDLCDPAAFAKWHAGCRNLLRMLGHVAEPWAKPFSRSADCYSFADARTMHSTLLAIHEAVEHNLLLDIEDLILAETFDSVLEQASYLHSEGYYLAAGVLGRAVLEEHLRKWCQHANCPPTKKRPTINDYSQALYKGRQFAVTVLKHIESMAAIGNDAAHNRSSLSADDVARLLRDLSDFLAKHSLSGSVI